MVVFVLDRASPGVRGELTRWLLELRAGVFVGHVSALVRDKLWEMLCLKLRGAKSAAILLYTTDTEQGFSLRTHGDTTRAVQDFDGLLLIRRP
ncbi:MAG: type I-E CRISPR-associated endoribonuclease Cas2e [Pyrinomonadaceae bacterium]